MSNALKFRSDLQGLRAIAVLLVVLAHAGFEGIDGGFIGVDIFFVLSGYLITGLLLREYDAAGRIDFSDFYLRRIKRLLPSLFVVIFATLLCASLLLSDYEFVARTQAGPYALTWLSNLYFAFTEVGYFAEMEQQDMFLHTWSLGVEEQFYLLWPAFIFAVLALRKKMGRPQLMLVVMLLVAVIASFALSLYWGAHQPMWAFYLMPARIWQFSLGALAFVLSPGLMGHVRSVKCAPLIQLLAVAIIFVAATRITTAMTYPGWAALAPSLSALLIMLFPVSGTGSHLLNLRALTYIGDRSYAWYLWHWPVFGLAGSSGLGIYWHQQLALMALSFMLAMVSHRLIEIPFWKGRFSRYTSARTFAGAVGFTVAMAAVTVSMLNFHEGRFRHSSNEQLAGAVQDMPAIYAYGCDTWYHSAEVQPCVFGDKSATRTLAFIGDSVLGQWFSLFATIYAPPEWRVVVFSKSSCPIVDEDFFYSRIGTVFEVCRTWRDSVLAGLGNIKPDVVVIGNAATYDFTEEQWIQGSSRVFERLSEVSPETYVVLGTPRLGINGPACLLKSESSVDAMRNNCMGTKTLKTSRRVSGYLQRASEQYGSVELLDFNELVCPGGQCSAITSDGTVVFRDSQHLTDTFVLSLLDRVYHRYPQLKYDS